MILPVLPQGGLFLGAAAAGFILAIFYDIFRLLRRIVPHTVLFIHIEDIIYWFIVVAIMFYFLLASNNGEIRLFCIAGAFIGMIAYFKLLSRFFLKISLTIYEVVKNVVLLLISIILAPIKAILHILSFPAAYAASKVRKAYDYEKKFYIVMKIRSRQKARRLKNNFRIIFKKI